MTHAPKESYPRSETQEVYAARAGRAYAAMQRRFRMRDGVYRRDGRLQLPGTAAHLWPFSRAFVATLDLAGVEHDVAVDLNPDAEIADRLTALERYWDPSGPRPAYSSDVLGSRLGGDRYYDDNAWVGLGLAQLERMRPQSGVLGRAEELYRFAVSGWDRRSGGIFWVEQNRGLGSRNHDRNTVSTAPNAELGLHLTELRGSPVTEDPPGPDEMCAWVLATLDSSRESDTPGTGLFWDKVRGDGTMDETIWSYNQGSMAGLHALLARRGGARHAECLSRAEAIARKAMRHFAGPGYQRQPPAFNAIFFRNLLLLHAQTGDGELRAEILDAMRGYAAYVWYERRDRRDLFQLADGGVTLLNQSAAVQVLALLAWDSRSYEMLA